MNTYLINTLLGKMIVMGNSPAEAFVKYTTSSDSIPLGDMFVEREELLKRGYRTLERTDLENVYELKK